MSIGERIKKRRIELNLSVDDLAKMLDRNRATVYRYENDNIENLPINVLEPLAKALKTTPTYLMGWEKEVDVGILNEGIDGLSDVQFNDSLISDFIANIDSKKINCDILDFESRLIELENLKQKQNDLSLKTEDLKLRYDSAVQIGIDESSIIEILENYAKKSKYITSEIDELEKTIQESYLDNLKQISVFNNTLEAIKDYASSIFIDQTRKKMIMFLNDVQGETVLDIPLGELDDDSLISLYNFYISMVKKKSDK